jgi:hypothetical protein
MIFGHSGYLTTPYRPFTGALAKNDAILAAAEAHADRFLVSACSGNPQVLVARLLTDPNNAVWEVWHGVAICGILLLDRIVPRVDARLQFVFFDDELSSKAPLLNDFVALCFNEFGLHRLTFEAPTPMTTLLGFTKRKLGFADEGVRVDSYNDGVRWYGVRTMFKLAPEV